jgi:BCD family chlorophyll transporter-like MFS transporter
MMIASCAITAGTVGAILDPFSFPRLIAITAMVSAISVTVTVLATWRLEGVREEGPITDLPRAQERDKGPGFTEAVREVLSERQTRRFTLFVFTSMLAYSAQDLVLEPFAGAVFGLTPGQSTQLGGLQHAGILAGMLFVALIGTRRGDGRLGILKLCLFAGCLGSALLLTALAVAGISGPPWPLHANVFALGFANGTFAIAAIATMMGLVSEGSRNRDGMRMGIWGAAQAIAFGTGGIVGTLSIDITRWWLESVSLAYAIVFVGQAILFAASAWLAIQVSASKRTKSNPTPVDYEISTVTTAHEL